ncbi:MAG: VWA domain-containing protein [Planctomycetes bacterium]|nr:VWA domain-containing protein [Planctomycetota bacterium]
MPFHSLALLALLAPLCSLSPRSVAVDSPGPSGPLPLALTTAPQARRPIAATLLHARVEIVDGVASTRLTLTIQNRGDAPEEATWLLPLPPGSVADDFRMTIGGKLASGEVLDAKRARGVYEGIVRAKRDPGLLEYVGRGCLKARIFPIPPRGSLDVEVGYRELLPLTGGLTRWALQVGAAGLDAGAPERTVLELTASSKRELRNAFSPIPGLHVVSEAQRVRASFEGGAVPGGELAVLFSLAEGEFGLDLLSTRASGAEEGSFLMLVSPKRDRKRAAAPTRELVFALDTSGSMSGPKLEQARGALRFFLRSLAPADRFNVVPFSTEARPFFPTTVPADAAHVEDALKRAESLRAAGGTNLTDALRSSLALRPASAGTVPLVVLLTDGLPSIEITDVHELAARAVEWNAASARVFVFGVGNDVNTVLLDTLAEQSGGTRGYVRDHEDIELAVGDLFTAIANPVLTNLELAVEGAVLERMIPRRLPDLFEGGRLVITGRYRGAGPCRVRLTANDGDERRTFEYDAVLASTPVAGLDFLPSLWAERRVAMLLDQLRLHGANAELVDEVRELGIEHRIVTPYTSHLILEEGLGMPPERGDTASAPATPGPSSPGPASPGAGGPATPGPSPRGPASPGASAERRAPDLASVTRRLVEAGVLPKDATAEEAQRLALALVKELREADQALAGLGERETGRGAVDDSVYLARLVGAGGARVDTGSSSTIPNSPGTVLTGSDAFFSGGTSAGMRVDLLSLFTRKVKDKVFVLRAGVWTDRTANEALPREDVEAFSDGWFALLERKPELAPYFAFSTRIDVVLDGRVYAVRASAKPER